MATAYAASLGYDYERKTGAPLLGLGEEQGFQVPAVDGADYNGPSAFPVSAPIAAELEKEFFSFSAPEGAFDDNNVNQQLSNSVKRGLRVIFIKSPENNGIENAALQLAKSVSDQRTAIYVLNKQADIGDLANKLNALNNNNNHKPEVHFVKYRTPADAENAQRTIQAQYDSLGGKSSSHNGGVAPVLDFASKAPLSGSAINGGLQAVEPSSTYLPANKRV